MSELVKESDQKIRVPKEQHKFLIGKQGIILRELQEKTCTSIQVPKSDALVNGDLITITGPKEGMLFLENFHICCNIFKKKCIGFSKM